MKKRKANKKILKAVDEIQEIYLIIDEIKNKDEKKIIHHLFQDLSDKLLDNVQKGKNKMKILRIDRQGAFDYQIYDNKKELKEALIDLHQPDMANDKDREALKKWSLNEVCEMFDWDYQTITDKQATQYE